ncbi:filamentous hemagglutinin family N-terminal domain protein [Selenomonas sp. FOBRC9]|uniref:MBG domain-containing protein n=1 Tax=Selenomonas sp. FOBRC9 TaxID=936573 RepID=UPI00027A4498|nr:MBG domain-containing protein [Selenomonas sp. FOBRC9]EJP33797.1 filamentous hemagglutinin family N-terminal domain protein [Selenomonas sp. FOBRC9]
MTLQDRIRRHLGGGIGAVTAGAFMLVGSGHALALPQGGEVAAGAAEIAQHAAEMAITQATQNAVINWNSFNIGAGERVNILQPNAQAALLNRVLGGSPSEIFGTLQANGRVFLVNPAGVLFAPGAHVDVGSLAATTMNITNADFMAGRYAFLGTSDGKVINRGSLIAQNEGTIALLGQDVRNEGVIVARKGTVALAAGEAVTLDFNGDGKVGVIPGKAALAQVVENKGLVEADGGLVFMSAAAGDALTSSVINQDGIVRAGSVDGRTGTIRMTAGEVRLGAGSRTDAGGASGGQIEIGGGWQGSGDLAHARNVNIVQGAEVHADAQADGGTGGTVAVWSDGRTDFRGAISARGKGTGAGGKIETSGKSVYITGAVNVASEQGKNGTWLIDPGNVTIKHLTGSETPSDTLIDVNSVSTSLDNGGAITFKTAEGDNEYSLTVQDAITKTSAAESTLNLKATGNIDIQASITSTGGKLNVDLLSDANGKNAGSVNIADGANITTRGGSLTIHGGLNQDGAALANAADAGKAGITIGNGTIDTRGTSGDGNVSLSGSAVGLNAHGIALNGTTVEAGTGTTTLIGKSASGKGISLPSSTHINTRSAVLRADSMDISGRVTGDDHGTAQIQRLTAGKLYFGTSGTDGLALAGNIFDTAGNVTHFEKNIVGAAGQDTNVIAGGVTAGTDLELYTGNSKLELIGNLNVGTKELTLHTTGGAEGGGAITAAALHFDAKDAAAELTGVQALDKIDGKGKKLALKNGRTLTVAGDAELTVGIGGATIETTAGDLTVGAHGVKNTGAGALNFKTGALNKITLAPGAVVASAGKADTTLSTGKIEFGSNASKISTKGGAVTLKTDALDVASAAAGAVASENGMVTVAPLTAGKTMSLGSSTAADVALPNTDFIASGTGAVKIGDAQTGDVHVGAATLTAPLSVESGTKVDFTGGMLKNTGVHATSFKAPTIDFSATQTLDTGAGTLNLTADTISNWNNVTFAPTAGAGTLAVQKYAPGNFAVGGTSAFVSDAGFAKIAVGAFRNAAIGSADNAGTATIDTITTLPSYTSILTNGALSVTGTVNGTVSDTLVLRGNGLTQSAPVKAGNLLLLGQGAMDFSTQPNEFTTIAADMSGGSLSLRNAHAMKVAKVVNRNDADKEVEGLKTQSTKLKVDGGKLDLSGGIQSANDTEITADDMDLGDKLSVGGILKLKKNTKSQAIDIGAGSGKWNVNKANYGSIEIGGADQVGDVNIDGTQFKKPVKIETQNKVKLTGETNVGAGGTSDMTIKAKSAELPSASDTLAVKDLTLDLSGGLDLGNGKVKGAANGNLTVKGASASQYIYVSDDAAHVPAADYRISYNTLNNTLTGFQGFGVAGEQHVYFDAGTVTKSVNVSGKQGVVLRDNVTLSGDQTKIKIASAQGGFSIENGKQLTVGGNKAEISIEAHNDFHIKDNAGIVVNGNDADIKLISTHGDAKLGTGAKVEIAGTGAKVFVNGNDFSLGADAQVDLGTDTKGSFTLHADTVTDTADSKTNITGKGVLTLATKTAGHALTINNAPAGVGLHLTSDQLNGGLFGSEFSTLTIGDAHTGAVTIDGVTANNNVRIENAGGTNALTIGDGGFTVGAGKSVTLRAGHIANSTLGEMNVGAGSTLNLYTDDLSGLHQVSGHSSVNGTGTLGVASYDGSKAIGLGDTAAGALALPNNLFTDVFGSGFSHYSIGSGAQDTINVAGTTLGKNVTLTAKHVNFTGNMTMADPGSILTVNSTTDTTQTGGIIDAKNVAVLGGNASLTKLNKIEKFAASAGSVDVRAEALHVGTITTPAGAPTASGTLNGIAASAGNITLSADAMTFDAGTKVRGTKSLVVQQANTGTNLNVGTAGTGLNLGTELFGGNVFADGFEHVYLGRADGTGATNVGGNLNFVDPTTIRSSATSGTMTAKSDARIATNGNPLEFNAKDFKDEAGSEIDTDTGAFTLKADSVDLKGKIRGKGELNLLPLSNNRDIRLGADTGNSLNLPETYFSGGSRVFWGYETYNIGDAGGTGKLYQSGTIEIPGKVNIRQSINTSTGGVNIGGIIKTNGKDYSIGSREVNLNGATISADNPDGVHHGNVSIQADRLTHTNSKITGHGKVSFDTYTANQVIKFGTPGTGGSPSGLDLGADLFSGTGLLQKNDDGTGFSEIHIGGANAGKVELGDVTIGEGLVDKVSIETNKEVVTTGGTAMKGVKTLDVKAKKVALTGENEIANIGDITSEQGVEITTKGGVNIAGTIRAKDDVKLVNKHGGNMSIAPTGKIIGTDSANVYLTAEDGAFKNKGGAQAITPAPGKRYVVYTKDSLENEIGGLHFDFERYGTPYGNTGDLSGNYSGSGFAYNVRPKITMYSTRVYGDANGTFFNDGSGFKITLENDPNGRRAARDHAGIEKIRSAKSNSGNFAYETNEHTAVNADLASGGAPGEVPTDLRPGMIGYGTGQAASSGKRIEFRNANLNPLNYEIDIDFRVVPRTVTVKGITDAKPYDGTAKTYTGYTGAGSGVTFSNFAPNETVATAGITGGVTYTPNVDPSRTSGYAQGALHAGNYTLGVTGNLSASNYNFKYEPGTLAITKRIINITAPNGERIYGAGNDTVTLTGSPTMSGTLAAGDTLASYSVRAMDGTNRVTERTNAGSGYTMTIDGIKLASGSRGYASDYNITSTSGTLTIKKRDLTITAGDKSRVYGDANTTARYVNNTRKVNVAATTATTGLVNGDAIDDVTETIDPSLNATTNAGTAGLWTKASGAHFSSGTDANYNITYINGHFNIEKRKLTLIAGDKSRIYGTANATANYVNGTNLFRVKAGTNLVNGDTISTVTETLDPAATVTTDAGTAGLKTKIKDAVFGTGLASNYDISYEDGSLAITPRALTLRAGDKTRVYGAENSTATYTGGTTKFRADAATATTGLVGTDTAADVTESTNAAVRTNAGTAGLRTNITNARFGTGKASNYSITYVDGGFTITPRDLTIRAGNKERVYGDANSTAHYVDGTQRINVDAATATTGLVNGDAIGSVTETIDPSLNATTNAGTAGLWTRVRGETFSKGLASNYNVHYADGVFRITKRPVTVTGVTVSRTYDGTAQHFTGYNGVTFDGFANGQSETSAGVISGGNIVYQPIANAGDTTGYAQGAIHAGTYDVGLSGSNLMANNYTFTYAPGTLTITPRALNLKAGDKTRIYGTENATAVYTGDTQKFRDVSTGANAGLVGTDTVGDVTETLDGTVRTNAGTPELKTHIGAAQFSHGKASDYAVTYTDGTLAITPRALTLRAGNKERAYGAENGTAVYTDGTKLFRADDMTATTGLVNGDTIGTVAETIDPNAGLSADAGTPGLWTRIGGAQFARGTASNYTITYVDGGFRIVPRVVRIAAGSVTRYMGEPNPAAPYTIERGTSVTRTGLLPGDEITGITPVYAPSITPNMTFGTYEGVITVTPGAWTYTGGTTPNMANYRFEYTAGNLTIRPRGFDSNTPGGRVVISGIAVNTPRSAADGGSASAGGNAPGVRVPDVRVTVEDGAGTVTIPSGELQNPVGSWGNRVVSGSKTIEAHELVTGSDDSFGYDLARDRGRIGIPDERIPGGTAEAVPVLFTDGGTRDLDGIYAINYNPNKLSIQPASKKVDIPDPSEIRSDSIEPMQFLYRNQGGEFKVLFGNGIVTLRPQNDKALSIVKDKDKAAERAVLASGLLAAIEDLGVTPVEIRAVYIFNVLEEDEE